jgi:hypothetical protein
MHASSAVSMPTRANATLHRVVCVPLLRRLRSPTVTNTPIRSHEARLESRPGACGRLKGVLAGNGDQRGPIDETAQPRAAPCAMENARRSVQSPAPPLRSVLGPASLYARLLECILEDSGN